MDYIDNLNFYLGHNVFGSKLIYKKTNKTIIRSILEDGFLRTSNETKNSKLTGDIFDPDYDKNSSKTIYFELNIKKKMHYTLYFDIQLLLKQTFWLNPSWLGGINKNISKKIDPKKLKLNLDDLTFILKEFKDIIIENINKIKLKSKFKYMFSNEILVKNPVSLRKYLLAIDGSVLNNDDIEYVKKNYPNTKII